MTLSTMQLCNLRFVDIVTNENWVPEKFKYRKRCKQVIRATVQYGDRTTHTYAGIPVEIHMKRHMDDSDCKQLRETPVLNWFDTNKSDILGWYDTTGVFCDDDVVARATKTFTKYMSDRLETYITTLNLNVVYPVDEGQTLEPRLTVKTAGGADVVMSLAHVPTIADRIIGFGYEAALEDITSFITKARLYYRGHVMTVAGWDQQEIVSKMHTLDRKEAVKR